MSIMRTKGLGKVIIAGTPKGGNSWMANYYQSNQTPKNPNFDTKGKLVIQNYSRDLTYAVFYGWDVISADETDEHYLFQLMARSQPKLRVYITLGRILQQPDIKYPETFYQCYIHDDNSEWDKTIWLDAKSINYKTFWNMIESVVDEYHPILPF